MTELKLQKTNKIDMLQGSLLDKLLLFALPLAASSILQQLFNSVDLAVVGHFSSSQAQAAVGGNGPLINLMLNLFIGVSVGANVVIANYIGQKREHGIQDTVHTSIVVAVVSGFALMLIGIAIARPVLAAMSTPRDVIELAILYLRIYFLGMPFILVYNFGAAVLRSIGDTKRPLISLVVSGMVNVGLNLFLVIVFHLGVAGVAIATVISNMISAGMVLYFLAHEQDPIRLYWHRLKVSKPELIKMLKIGIPAGVQGMVFSLSNVCIQAVINGYGSDVVAGSTIAFNYEHFVFFVIGAFNQTVVTFTSQNFGAGQFDRCKQIFRISMIVSVVVTCCMSWSFVLGREFFVSLFTSEPAVAHYACLRLIYIQTLVLIANSYEIGGAALRGIGYSATPAVLTVFGTCVLRLIWVFTISRWFPGFETLMYVYPLSWAVTGIAVLLAYFMIRKKVFSTGV